MYTKHTHTITGSVYTVWKYKEMSYRRMIVKVIRKDIMMNNSKVYLHEILSLYV